MKKSDTLTLTATVLPENATDKRVVWSVADAADGTASAVTVSAGGAVTAADIGKATVVATTKDGGLTASCDILVVDPEIDEETLKTITPDETYTEGYTPVEETGKVDTALDTVPTVTLNGETVQIPVSLTYQPVFTYIGKSIAPKQVVEKFDKTAIVSGLTLKEGAKITDLSDLIDVKCTAKSNKNAGGREAAYFKAKVTINKKAKKSLSKEDYKILKKKVAAVNKELKKNKYKFTINRRSVTDGTLIVKVQMKKGVIKTKKGGKVSKVKSIKLVTTDPFDATKTITVTVPAKNYKIEVIDAKAGLVRVTGKKNFTGSTTVYVK